MTMLECAMYLCNRSYYTRTVNPQCGPSDSPRSRSGNGCFTTKDPLEGGRSGYDFGSGVHIYPTWPMDATVRHPTIGRVSSLWQSRLVDQQTRLQLAVDRIKQLQLPVV